MTVQEMREALIEAGYSFSGGKVGWKEWYTWTAPNGCQIEADYETSPQYKELATIQAYSNLLLDRRRQIG